MKLNKAFERTSRKFVSIVQKILITLLLFLVYFLGFGFTLILSFLFNRKDAFGGLKSQDSSWLKAEGYKADFDNSFRQS